MNNKLNDDINNAIEKCKKRFVGYDFSELYPFTTENIHGYIKNFDLNNKSLLTVGSSSDQVINASFYNPKNITLIDICPYSKYYFFLKKSALIDLNYYEFLNYLCYHDFPKVFDDNKDSFNIKSFNKIKDTLKCLDEDSYTFWSELYKNINPLNIRKYLFSYDEDRFCKQKHINIYLKNERNYKIASNLIKNITPEFIIDDITKVELSDNYDNIFLSNIAQYISLENLKTLLDKLDNNLNIDGQILLAYLYNTNKDTKFNKEWAPIYNLKETYKILKDYITFYKEFIGVRGVLFREPKIKDVALIYKKTK